MGEQIGRDGAGGNGTAAAAATASVAPVARRNPSGRPRVVILGGGFAGINAARQLGRADVDVTVIDRTNHFLFQPLLYQVATAALAPSDISAPIRFLLRKQKNTTVLLAEVHEILPDRKVVTIDRGEDEIPYDYLVLATGSRHSYFGHDDWEENAPGLKSLGDALGIRHRFLKAFEDAEKLEVERLARLEEGKSAESVADLERERDALLTFCIVGGGPTGCELAGVMHEIARRALSPDFRHIDASQIKVHLIEAGPRVLAAFPEDLSKSGAQQLTALGVDILTGDPVTALDDRSVTLKSGRRIDTRMVIWAAGNAASPLTKTLGVPLTRAGQVEVEPDLSVPGRPEIFVAGDLAAAKTAVPEGKPIPYVAQWAMQGGTVAGKNVLHRIRGEQTEAFKYFDKGNMAVIGRNRAIADLRFVHLHGFLAWLAWAFIHILYLVGFRNRASVLVQWAYAYLTFQRGVRLINEAEPVHSKPVEQEQRERGQPVQAPVGATVGPWPK
jgi:NADH dehydrogenase